MKPAKELAIVSGTGDVTAVKRLLAKDPALAKDWQPLMDACSWGRVDVVKLLLERGADPNILSKSAQKYRPLHRTVEHKITPEMRRGPHHIEVVKLLLKAGADPMLRGTSSNVTAIAVAVFGGELQFVPVLLKKGLALDIYAAALLGDETRVAALLKGDPSLAKQRDASGMSALGYCARSRIATSDPSKRDGLVRIAKLLLDRGADVSDVLDPACWARNVPMVQLFLAHGAKLRDGDTINHAACDGNEDVLELLVKHGADLRDTRGTDHHGGYEPFGCAVTCRSVRGAKWFLDHGLDPNHVGGTRGETALHVAVRYGCSPEMLKLLIDRGVKINARDKNGDSALALARAGKKAKAVDFLTTAGAK